ncbi:poly-gamma-glutamate hydrolase family protein [Nostoc sp. UHCC 0702]|nr:poly-gamma-glutamate hydrolase family protein [Nostoc sp. UHCC 0702]
MVTQINTDQSKISFSKYIQKLKDFLVIITIIISLSVFSGNDIAKADTFGCFIGAGTTPASTCNDLPSLLSSSIDEETDDNKDENKCLRSVDGDWHTTIKNNESDVTVLSIHGGNIEPGTSKISQDLEKLYKWDRYNFEGHVTRDKCKQVNSSCKDSNFCLFHITSNNFNDPDAESSTGLVRLNPKAVSIHGCSSLCTPLIEVKDKNDKTTKVPDPDLLDQSNTICIGGKNLTTRKLVRTYINEYKVLTSNPPLTFVNNQSESYDTGAYCNSGILGTSLDNIVNKTNSNEGLQLEISKDIREKLADDSISNDLLRTIVYGGAAEGVGKLPLPILIFEENHIVVQNNGKEYNLNVANKSKYVDLFVAAPNLPPCQPNTNSSRTRVIIYNATNDQEIGSFCALASSNDLDSISFFVASNTTPPTAVYITLEDRLNNRIYRSNRVNITP